MWKTNPSIILKPLTYNNELDGALYFRLRADLTLVQPGISRLNVSNLKGPVVCVLWMEALEAPIGYERIPVQGEDVRVPIPHP